MNNGMVTKKEIKIYFDKRSLANLLNLPDDMEISGFYTREDPDVFCVKIRSDRFSRAEAYGEGELPIIPFHQLTDDQVITDTLKKYRTHPEWF